MKPPQLSSVRDLALIILSTAATATAVDELRSLCGRRGPRHQFAPPLPASAHLPAPGYFSPPPPPSAPRPAHGWLYEASGWDGTARRIRPATAAERAASEATRHVDGTGIFALLEDNTIVRSDAPGYPPAVAVFTRYCWAAD